MKTIMLYDSVGTNHSVVVEDANVDAFIDLVSEYGNIIFNIPWFRMKTFATSTEFISNTFGDFIINVHDEDHPSLVEFFDVSTFVVNLGMQGGDNPFTGQLAAQWNVGQTYADDMRRMEELANV